MSNAKPQQKPVVYFDKLARFEQCFGDKCAVLRGVHNHPCLGDQMIVYTSAVWQVVEDGFGNLVEIETRDTTYRPFTSVSSDDTSSAA